MTTAQRLAQLAATCPHLARNLGLLPPEQLQTILTDPKEPKR
ncbi:hypothetical protein [Paenarthrobacter nitroguajacolicus]|nr:hypothetical protein [Paenarthrobacter nitroguajacolicus]